MSVIVFVEEFNVKLVEFEFVRKKVKLLVVFWLDVFMVYIVVFVLFLLIVVE